MNKEALQLAALADDAFDAATTTFFNIVAGTIRDYGNVVYMRKCGGSPVACSTFLNKKLLSLMNIESLPLLKSEKDIDTIIKELYKHAVTATQARVTQIRGALLLLLKMAKLYRQLCILANQYANEIPVLSKIQDVNIELHVQKEEFELWAGIFSEEFKPLIARNHIEDIGPTVVRLKSDRESTLYIKTDA